MQHETFHIVLPLLNDNMKKIITKLGLIIIACKGHWQKQHQYNTIPVAWPNNYLEREKWVKNVANYARGSRLLLNLNSIPFYLMTNPMVKNITV